MSDLIKSSPSDEYNRKLQPRAITTTPQELYERQTDRQTDRGCVELVSEAAEQKPHHLTSIDCCSGFALLSVPADPKFKTT